jgi:hypothetical protein
MSVQFVHQLLINLRALGDVRFGAGKLFDRFLGVVATIRPPSFVSTVRVLREFTLPKITGYAMHVLQMPEACVGAWDTDCDVTDLVDRFERRPGREGRIRVLGTFA